MPGVRGYSLQVPGIPSTHLCTKAAQPSPGEATAHTAQFLMQPAWLYPVYGEAGANTQLLPSPNCTHDALPSSALWLTEEQLSVVGGQEPGLKNQSWLWLSSQSLSKSLALSGPWLPLL